HNSNLIVPAVALTNDKLIAAESFEEVITSDDETIVSGLKKALLILDAQYTYIYKLPIEETICDEWVKPEEIKKSIYTKIEAIQDNVTKALQVHQEDNNSDALMEIRGVLGQLDDLAVEIKNLCAKGNIGRVAYDTI
ncbi:hypothetical protein H8E77_24490, partial [bacterium]|nr:hypothetical protein [bacterium]